MKPYAILVGPPGAGKSTVGRLLAGRLGTTFRDVDDDVERRAGKTISEIFTEDGEDAFRLLEEEAVAAALSEHGGVLALGGGAVVTAGTRARLSGHAVVFLSVGLAEGVRRTGLSQARPLMSGVNPRATFKAHLDERAPLYREVAGIEIDTDEQEPEELVSAIVADLAAETPS